MKRIVAAIAMVLGMHTVQAGSNEALMDWDLGNAFGSMLYKINSVGTQQTLASYARIGFILNDNQFIYVAKGGANSNEDLLNATPPPYLMAQEFIGYEYLIDFGFFIDLGISAEIGGLVLGDGTTTTTGGAFEGTLYAVINLSQSIKLQLGYGQRYSFMDNAKLTALGLTASDVDTAYYSFALDIGGF